jgi:hypothetical protein
MDIGLNVRASAGTAPAPARTDATSVRLGAQQYATALPADKVVGSVVEPAASRADLSDQAKAQAKRQTAVSNFIETKQFYNREARTVVIRSVDSRSGTVVRQFPDDVALTIRAFVNEIEKKQEASREANEKGKFDKTA